MSTHNASRRLFLRHAGAMSTLGAAAPLALNLSAIGSAAAQSATDYKALVCIFLFGGNDSMNMVLPTDTASWNSYTTIRNQAPDSIALLAPGVAPLTTAAAASPARLGGVLPITPVNAQGRSFALHPVMGTLQTMFNTDGRLAILPNVGPLILPTTKAQYGTASFPKPVNLYSHNDQQNTWQSFKPEGSTQGWGAHHFVMGGAVKGGDLYGTFPVLGTKNANNNNFDSSPDQLGNGALLPTTSVDQLGATLAKWFGISDTDALSVFPHLGSFTARDLGFMKPG